MRFVRVVAFAAWAAIASLAIAGFAVFSPGAPNAQPAAEATTTVIIRSDWGSLSGRVAAMAFVTGARTAEADAEPMPTEEAALMVLAEPDVRTAITNTSTTTAPVAPPTTRAAPTTTRPKPPPTTSPPTTTPATTTTAPPSTTTTQPPPDTTTTVPPPQTFPAAVERWRSLVEQYFQPADVNLALHLIDCESGGDPDATNRRSGAAGLFQHLPKYWEARAASAGFEGASIYDPAANTGTAAWLAYQGGGWGHWSPCLP